MKIALCFFGLPRTYEKCLPSILNFFEGNEIESYILTWKEEENLEEKIRKFLTPKKFAFFEDLENFEEIKKINQEYLETPGPIEGKFDKSTNYIFQTFGRKEVCKLFASEEKFTPDIIFTLRMDVIIEGVFPKDVVVEDGIIYGGMDLIFYGNPKTLLKFTEFDPPYVVGNPIFSDPDAERKHHFKPEIQYCERIKALNFTFRPTLKSRIVGR